MKPLRCLVVAAALATSVPGCGQKGPLVLPDAQHPSKKLKVPKAPAASTPKTPAAPPDGAGPRDDTATAPPPASPASAAPTPLPPQS